jgi:GntR family transcriptional regulator
LHLFPRLIDEYTEQDSLYRMLLQDYGNGPLRAHDVLEPVLINSFESGILHVPIGSPGILIERTAYGSQDTPIEYTKSVFRGDMCRFSIDLGVNKSHDG